MGKILRYFALGLICLNCFVIALVIWGTFFDKISFWTYVVAATNGVMIPLNMWTYNHNRSI